jgi:hypothetical protein
MASGKASICTEMMHPEAIPPSRPKASQVNFILREKNAKLFTSFKKSAAPGQGTGIYLMDNQEIEAFALCTLANASKTVFGQFTNARSIIAAFSSEKRWMKIK